MRQGQNTKKLSVFKGFVSACLLGTSLVGGTAAWAECPDDYQTARAGDYDIKGPEVTEKKTGVTWQRCAVGQTFENNRCMGSPKAMTFEQAKAAVTAGWRLPSKAELETIRMEGCAFPAVNTILYLSLEGRKYWYWTSTEEDTGAWALNPEGGAMANTPKTDLAAILLVK